MAHDGQDITAAGQVILPDLLKLTGATIAPLNDLLEKAQASVRALVLKGGDKITTPAVEAEQTATHGLAWLATYVESLRQMQKWAEKLDGEGKFAEMEQLIHQIAFGEYLWQIIGGIQMSQNEIVRLQDLGLSPADQATLNADAVSTLCQSGNTQAARSRLAELMVEQQGATMFGASGLDEELEMIRDQFRRYAVEKVEPHAHEWHLKDELIPMSVIEELSEMGVFGLTIPENLGGFGLPKAAMVVVSEELSRGYIGVGSLATRSEIAAELILAGGTDEQRSYWLPKISSGEILPTADDNGDYKITGNKTWITHAARTHVMTVLARTDPSSTDHNGLSMFLAEKTPGTDENPFPTDGMTGGEIEVLGYRGMKEYELGFDNFHVKGDNLLGGVEGQGFRQLMKTFEAARIQTAARAIGVAQAALDVGLQYALDRKAFAQPLANFPRVSGKLAMMAVEIVIARQLTYFSAYEKDNDRRCDLEAGMAKLLGARVAWASADNALQIHGGNGFALEYTISRILCDARILNIFEGAAEIQAQVIARRLLA
eukprot:g15426.t1